MNTLTISNNELKSRDLVPLWRKGEKSDRSSSGVS